LGSRTIARMRVSQEVGPYEPTSRSLLCGRRVPRYRQRETSRARLACGQGSLHTMATTGGTDGGARSACASPLRHNIGAVHHLNASLVHICQSTSQGSLRVDASAGILYYNGLKSRLASIDRSPSDAEIRRKADNKHACNSALLQIA